MYLSWQTKCQLKKKEKEKEDFLEQHKFGIYFPLVVNTSRTFTVSILIVFIQYVEDYLLFKKNMNNKVVLMTLQTREMCTITQVMPKSIYEYFC